MKCIYLNGIHSADSTYIGRAKLSTWDESLKPNYENRISSVAAPEPVLHPLNFSHVFTRQAIILEPFIIFFHFYI